VSHPSREEALEGGMRDPATAEVALPVPPLL